MPYVDGRKVSSAIKSAAPATIVVLLTGWGQRLVADGDIPPHVDEVLSKPPKLRELRQAFARCWNALEEHQGPLASKLTECVTPQGTGVASRGCTSEALEHYPQAPCSWMILGDIGRLQHPNGGPSHAPSSRRRSTD